MIISGVFTTFSRYRPRDILIRLVDIRHRRRNRHSNRHRRRPRTGAAGDGRPAVWSRRNTRGRTLPAPSAWRPGRTGAWPSPAGQRRPVPFSETPVDARPMLAGAWRSCPGTGGRPPWVRRTRNRRSTRPPRRCSRVRRTVGRTAVRAPCSGGNRRTGCSAGRATDPWRCQSRTALARPWTGTATGCSVSRPGDTVPPSGARTPGPWTSGTRTTCRGRRSQSDQLRPTDESRGPSCSAPIPLPSWADCRRRPCRLALQHRTHRRDCWICMLYLTRIANFTFRK